MCHATETVNCSIEKSCQDVNGKFEAVFLCQLQLCQSILTHSLNGGYLYRSLTKVYKPYDPACIKIMPIRPPTVFMSL
jgi:hypothetical protein